MPTDELLNVVQAAAYLSIRPWTLRHWIADGKIEVVKYGNGAVRLRRSVLERFVARCTIKPRKRNGGESSSEPRLLEGSRLGRDEHAVADRNPVP